MRKSRFTEGQIVGILKELKAGAKSATLSRKYDVNETTLYNWRSKYSGLELSDLAKLRQLEDENRRLKMTNNCETVLQSALNAAGTGITLQGVPSENQGTLAPQGAVQVNPASLPSPTASTSVTGDGFDQQFESDASEAEQFAVWGAEYAY